MKKYGLYYILIIYLLIFILFLSNTSIACKDIIACGDSTKGDYNLLLKVRDPSRPGLQVLTIVPRGYEYNYHHPRTGETIFFKTKHKYIGVATIGDTIPEIVKAGMTLTDSGLAFGDADTNSNWINSRKYAWDDFDWIRYACQQADDEEEAMTLLTKNAVDDLHASSISENLFIIGPNIGYLIEADAFRYFIHKIENDIQVMSNYPKELWRSQIHKKLPISNSFDTEKEQFVRKGRILRLNSIYGVKIVDIKNNSIVARQVPFFKIIDKSIRFVGKRIDIPLKERKTIGDYSVELLEIKGKNSKIRLINKFKAWEEEMMKHIQPRYGSITISDMINWSRLTSDDLDGLRPMCEELYDYEAVTIYKIPSKNYEILSCGWFAANHATSSIFVPFHICNNNIYDPFENGESARLSLELYKSNLNYLLTDVFTRTEQVFLYENKIAETVVSDLIKEGHNASNFLTIIDISMQRQAWLTQNLWMYLNNSYNQKEIISIVQDIWDKNYSKTIQNMRTAVQYLENLTGFEVIINKIIEIALDICQSHIDASESIYKNNINADLDFKTGKKLLESRNYNSGFNYLQSSYKWSDQAINGDLDKYINENIEDIKEKINTDSILIILISVVLLFLIIFVLIYIYK